MCCIVATFLISLPERPRIDQYGKSENKKHYVIHFYVRHNTALPLNIVILYKQLLDIRYKNLRYSNFFGFCNFNYKKVFWTGWAFLLDSNSFFFLSSCFFHDSDQFISSFIEYIQILEIRVLVNEVTFADLFIPDDFVRKLFNYQKVVQGQLSQWYLCPAAVHLSFLVISKHLSIFPSHCLALWSPSWLLYNKTFPAPRPFWSSLRWASLRASLWGQTDGWKNSQMVRWWVDRRMDRWTDGQKDGQMAKWMEITSCVLYCHSSKGIHVLVNLCWSFQTRWWIGRTCAGNYERHKMSFEYFDTVTLRLTTFQGTKFFYALDQTEPI